VRTDATVDIARTAARPSGSLVDAGWPIPTDYGNLLSTSPNPVLGGSGVVESHGGPTDGSTWGAWNTSYTGLNANTLYYTRAFATNSQGTGYGEVVTFRTLP
jgi:hypothetical protein